MPSTGTRNNFLPVGSYLSSGIKLRISTVIHLAEMLSSIPKVLNYVQDWEISLGCHTLRYDRYKVTWCETDKHRSDKPFVH